MNDPIFDDLARRSKPSSYVQLIESFLQLYTSSTSRKDYLESAVDLIHDWSGCQGVGIRVLDREENIPYEAYRGFSREFWAMENFLSLKRDQCVCTRIVAGRVEDQDLQCLTSSDSFFCNDTANFVGGLNQYEQSRFRGACVNWGYLSVAVVPFRWQGKILGAIHLADKRKGMVPLAMVEHLEMAAPILGEATHRFELEGVRQKDSFVESALSSILRLSKEHVPVEELLVRALETVLTLHWFPSGSKGAIFVAEGNSLVLKAQKGFSEARTQPCSSVLFGQCICGKAASDKRLWTGRGAVLPEKPCNSNSGRCDCYCVPILFGESVLGLITVQAGRREDAIIQDRQRVSNLLALVADTLAIGLARRQTEENLRRWRDIVQYAHWGVNVGRNEVQRIERKENDTPAYTRMREFPKDKLAAGNLAELPAFKSQVEPEKAPRVFRKMGRISIESEHFRAVFDESPIGIVIVGREGYILESNHTFQTMLGYKADELIGMDVCQIHPDESNSWEIDVLGNPPQDRLGARRVKKRFLRKDGEVIWGRLSVSVVRNADGMPLFTIGMVEDETENQRLLTHIEKLNDELAKQAAERTDELEAANRTYQETITELSRVKESFVQIQEQLQAKQQQLISARLREKELAEEARNANRILRATIDTVPAGVVVSDTSGEIIVSSSKLYGPIGLATIWDISGAESEYFLRRPDGTILKPKDLPLACSLRGEYVRDMEILVYKDDCCCSALLVSASPITDDVDRIIGAIAAWQDITERKSVENRHTRMLEQLRRAQKLETAGRIAGQVAHDFNNLLSPLVTCAELIKSRLDDDDPAYRYCDDILEIVHEMAEVNNNLLALGRRAEYALQPVDINRVINQVIEQMAERFAGVTIATDLAPNLPCVNGSSSQLRRVLINLITNSCEAMEGSGLLSIKTEQVRLDKPFDGYERIEAGEYVKLSMSDNGCGIPAEIRDKIFDAFFSTKANSERLGMGLGLSIVQAIMRDHEGYIDLSSEVGKGTTFSLYLPISEL